jgi:hypothetical protein
MQIVQHGIGYDLDHSDTAGHGPAARYQPRNEKSRTRTRDAPTQGFNNATQLGIIQDPFLS